MNVNSLLNAKVPIFGVLVVVIFLKIPFVKDFLGLYKLT